jgi:peroxiredoxin Q/BCP
MSDTKLNVTVGKPAPDFSLPNQDGKEVSLKQLKGKWVALFFYPKDDTSGCTMEAIDFSGKLAAFEKLSATVIGISPDSCESHQKFIRKHQLKMMLISDTNQQLAEQYGIWQLKKLYGKEYMGVVRTTLLIDPTGKVAEIWPNVKVDGHADAVLEKIKSLT